MKNITNLLFTLFFFSVINTHAIIQRVRINFTGPDGYTRFLLLGFTSDNAASDAYDYGYDALNIDNLPNDLNWMIEDQRYVIQGVGAFDTCKYYRLGMFLQDSGNIQISLNSLENFDTIISVFLYDIQQNSFTKLNNTNFNLNITNGNYTDRFFIAFSQSPNYVLNGAAALSIEDYGGIDSSSITFYQTSRKIVLKSSQNGEYIERLSIYDLSGKEVLTTNYIGEKDFNINYSFKSDVYIVSVITNYNKPLRKMIIIQ